MVFNFDSQKSYFARDYLNLEKKSGFNVSKDSFLVLEDLISSITSNPKVRSLSQKYHTTRDQKTLAADISLVFDGIIKDKGFYYEETVNFSDALLKKGISCKDFTLIYKSLGEKLNLPISAASSIGHIFPRFIFENGSHINVEASYGAKIMPDEHFIYRPDKKFPDRFRISKEALEHGAYLKTFSEKELKGQYEGILGSQWYVHKDFNKAIKYSKKAIDSCPFDPHAYETIARSTFSLEDYLTSFEYSQKSLELEPNGFFARRLNVLTAKILGNAFYEKREYKKALDFYNSAIELDSEDFAPFREKADALFELKDYNSALKFYKKAKKQNPFDEFSLSRISNLNKFNK